MFIGWRSAIFRGVSFLKKECFLTEFEIDYWSTLPSIEGRTRREATVIQQAELYPDTHVHTHPHTHTHTQICILFKRNDSQYDIRKIAF